MKLLVVDDEFLIREAIIARLHKGNYRFEEIYQAEDGREAMHLLLQHRPELVITDVRMEGMNGLDLIRESQQQQLPCVFIVISGYAEFDYVQKAMYHGACCYLLKPITKEALYDAVEKALVHCQSRARYALIEKENEYLKIRKLFSECKNDQISPEDYQEFLQLIGGRKARAFLLSSLHLSGYHKDRYFSAEDAFSIFGNELSRRLSIPFRILPGEARTERYLLFWGNELPARKAEILSALQAQVKKMNIQGAILTAGLGSITPSLSGFSFSSCADALKQRFAGGNGSVYSYDGASPSGEESRDPLDPSAALSRRAKEYIRLHYAEEINLDSMAAVFHLNPRYFSTVFKKREGISPTDFLTEVRLRQAGRLLRETSLPASEIAEAVGYADPRYFYKVFKKHTGMTPKEYRAGGKP